MTEQLVAQVSINESATPEELVAIRELFDQAGFKVTVSANYGQKSIEELPRVVFISMGADMFVGQIVKRAADDAYDAAKRFIDDLWATRRRHAGPSGNVILDDRGNHQWVMLDEHLPQEAYRALEQPAVRCEEEHGCGVEWSCSTTQQAHGETPWRSNSQLKPDAHTKSESVNLDAPDCAVHDHADRRAATPGRQ